MQVIFFLLSISLGLGITFLFAFLWWIKSGQNQDLEGPAMRILFEDKIDKK